MLNLLLKGYLIVIPISGLLYYYFKVYEATFANHLFIGLFVVYAALFLKSASRNYIIGVLILLSTGLLSTLYQVITESNFDIVTFVKHFLAILVIVLLFQLGQKISFFRWFSINHKFIYVYLFIDFMIISFFTIDPLLMGVYPSFESSFLVPSFVYSLVTSNKLMLILHLALFVLHGKRAVLIFVLFAMFIYYALNKETRKKLYIAILFLFISIFTIDLELIVGQRYLNIYIFLQDYDLNSVSSLKERYDEMVGSSFLKTGVINTLFGNGYGWYYFLLDFEGMPVRRNYIHLTLMFVFITYGLIGVLGYLLIHIKAIIRNIFSRNIERIMYGYIVLIYFLISFSVFNVATNPLYALFLGAAFYKANNR